LDKVAKKYIEGPDGTPEESTPPERLEYMKKIMKISI
jgi:hypothetical protein